MRPELERIEKILAYLNNEMSLSDQRLFQLDMKSDNALKNEVDQVSTLVDAFKNNIIRKEIQYAQKKYFNFQVLKKIIIALAIAAAFGMTIFLLQKTNDRQETEKSTQAEVTYDIDNETSDPSFSEQNLEVQEFIIDNSKTNVIETKEGIVIAIAPNSFNSSQKEIELKIKEALKPADIIKAGLSTTYQDKLLETSGMFEIRAFDGQSELELVKEIIAEIPLLDEEFDYQLFDGRKDSLGNIVWENPKELEFFIETYDMNTLNFYPPEYEAGLIKLGKTNLSKAQKDSIYFNASCEAQSYYQEINALNESPENIDFYDSLGDFNFRARLIENTANIPVRTDYCDRCVQPSQVRSFWNSRFNNTILATKEFEERMKFLHQTEGGQEVLNCIISYFNDNIEQIDSILYKETAWRILSQVKTRKSGRVRPNVGLNSDLRAYYNEKRRTFENEIQENSKKMVKEYQAGMRNLASQMDKLNSLNSRDNVRLNQYETNKTLDKAYETLGMKRRQNSQKTNYNYFSRVTARIRTTGWKNIDRVVAESIATRESIDFTDKKTKKNFKLEMVPITIDCSEWDAQNSAVYLMPDDQESYLKLQIQNGKVNYKLNELLEYRMIFVGFKDNKYYYQEIENINGSFVRITPTERSWAEIQSKLNKNYKGPLMEENQILAQLKYLTEKYQFDNSQVNLDMQFQQKIRPYIFNCLNLVESP